MKRDSAGLLSISEMGKAGIEYILDLTTALDAGDLEIPRLNKSVGLFFLEDSTRTRLSFEAAARRLSASVINFSAKGSSISKGESLRDAAETIVSLGADCLVVRHRSSGVPWQLSRWVDVPVINAGDGSHAHPTQALLDCYTIRQHLGDLKGLRILIVGDIAHSRVARSCIKAFSLLGANITISAPPTLLPSGVSNWGREDGDIEITSDLHSALETSDVVYLLRLQRERQADALLPSIREYRTRFALTKERAGMVKDHTLIMHPGPINRGVEIDDSAAPPGRTVVSDQVRNGISVRMAVLYHLLSEDLPGNLPKDLPGNLLGDRYSK